MRLGDLWGVIDAAELKEPWPLSGLECQETLTLVRLPQGELPPPFDDGQILSTSFVLVVHIAHVPETLILGFDTLEALEASILSGAGLINFFTTHSVAVIDGRLRRFHLVVRDRQGDERVFCKTGQLELGRFVASGTPVRVEWLSVL